MVVAVSSSRGVFRVIASNGLALVLAIAAARGANSGAEPNRAFFGDLHLHTVFSFDAFVFKTTATPDDAYKFAKGGRMPRPGGGFYQLKRPLDFLAVTDHSEFLGVMRATADRGSLLSQIPIAKMVNDPDPWVSSKAFDKFIKAVVGGKGETVLGDPATMGPAIARTEKDAWETTVETANRNDQPGKFTAFIGYEWTSAPNGRTLHRNVIFRGDRAPQPFTALDSQNPEDLWSFIEAQRRKGNDALVIPHSPNLSDGLAFEMTDLKGQPITADYARRRSFYERLVEVTQIKGTSETHPTLSPTDECANFEIYEEVPGANLHITKFAGGYVRDALKRGLLLYESEGVNPYHYGMIGSSDSHNGMTMPEEGVHPGPSLPTTAEQQLDCTFCGKIDTRRESSGGLPAAIQERAFSSPIWYDVAPMP